MASFVSRDPRLINDLIFRLNSDPVFSQLGPRVRARISPRHTAREGVFSARLTMATEASCSNFTTPQFCALAHHNFAPCRRVSLQALWRKRCDEVLSWKRSTLEN